MPHCIIEYSNTITQFTTPEHLMECAFQAAVDSRLFDVADIKTRAIAYENFKPGDNKHNFICVTLKIMSGRSEAQKIDLSNRMLKMLETLEIKSTTITVEVLDIDRVTYAKSNL